MDLCCGDGGEYEEKFYILKVKLNVFGEGLDMGDDGEDKVILRLSLRFCIMK